MKDEECTQETVEILHVESLLSVSLLSWTYYDSTVESR